MQKLPANSGQLCSHSHSHTHTTPLSPRAQKQLQLIQNSTPQQLANSNSIFNHNTNEIGRNVDNERDTRTIVKMACYNYIQMCKLSHTRKNNLKHIVVSRFENETEGQKYYENIIGQIIYLRKNFHKQQLQGKFNTIYDKSPFVISLFTKLSNAVELY